jgi:hypothetical protein
MRQRITTISNGSRRTTPWFQRLAPHHALAVAADGKVNPWAGTGGADPGRAVESMAKLREGRNNRPASCGDRLVCWQLLAVSLGISPRGYDLT